MTTTRVAFVVVLMQAGSLWAAQAPTWENYKGTRLGFDLKIPDMLQRVVQLLKDPNPATRQNAATAMQLFGREAGRYLPEIQEALGQEKDPDIQGILKGALEIVSTPER